jgi:formate dehydrogenase subunit gamma
MLDAAQPEGLAERVTEILAAHAGVEGALLPILHAVQADYGFVPQAALPQIAAALGQTRADKKVTLEPIYCLGLCACGPAAQVDGKLVGRLDAAKLAKIKSEIGA